MPIGASTAPDRFSWLFKSADMVIVGSVESARQLHGSTEQESASKGKVFPYSPGFTCEYAVRVAVVIKTGARAVAPGETVNIRWRRASPDCSVSAGADRVTSIWMTEIKNGFPQVVDDSEYGVCPLNYFSAETEKELAKWKEPSLAAAYLVLKPGVLVPEKEYFGSQLPGDMVDLIGLRDFLSMLGSIYVSASVSQRDEIAIATSSLGFCVAAARRAAAISGRPRGWLALDEDNIRKRAELDLIQMSVGSKEKYIDLFVTAENATQNLTLLTCNSDRRVRSRAGALLLQYFGIDPSTIACIPCEE